MAIIPTLYFYPTNQTCKALFATRFITIMPSKFKFIITVPSKFKDFQTHHSKSLAKSQGEGSSTNIVIHGELRPYGTKLDAKAIGGPTAGADVALARSSDRYKKFDWWSHDVGDPGF
jgi:hypothetical protein